MKTPKMPPNSKPKSVSNSSDRNQGESLDGMSMPSGNSLEKVSQMYMNLEKFYGMQRNYIEKLRTAFMDVQNKGSNNQNVRLFRGRRKGPEGISGLF